MVLEDFEYFVGDFWEVADELLEDCGEHGDGLDSLGFVVAAVEVAHERAAVVDFGTLGQKVFYDL